MTWSLDSYGDLSPVDRVVLIASLASGVPVAVVVSLMCGRWKRIRAAIAGFAIGLIPCAAGVSWGLIFIPRTVDASAGLVALSLWVSVPNVIGGAVGGFLCSQLSRGMS